MFSQCISLEKGSEMSGKAKFWLENLCPEVEIREDGDTTLFFERASAMVPGEYRLSVKRERISVTYGDDDGARCAIASLSFLVRDSGIECVEISDCPDNAFRACLIDLARGYVEIPVLREHIVRMSKLKYNVLHLHLMDRQSYALDSDAVPNPDGHRLYSKADMRELVDFATRLGLEVIPEIEFPAHAVNQLKAIPSLACELIDKRAAMERVQSATEPRKLEFIDREGGISSWTVCLGNENTYEVYERIIAEICEIFPGKYLHTGGDEFEFAHLAAHPHWDNCKRCRERMESLGLDNTRALYYYGLSRLHEFVTKRGKRMIIWNDQLDVWNKIDIPKDIMVYFWRYDLITKEKGVFQALLDQGFECVNAHYKYTYFDEQSHMQEKKIEQWTTHTENLGEPEVKGKILGGILSAWSLGDKSYPHNKYVFPPAAVLFSDRVWNNETFEYDAEYRRAVYAAVSGDNDSEIDPYGFFNEILPPRSSRSKRLVEDVDLELIDASALGAAISALSSAKSFYGKIAVSELLRCLEMIKSSL